MITPDEIQKEYGNVLTLMSYLNIRYDFAKNIFQYGCKKRLFSFLQHSVSDRKYYFVSEIDIKRHFLRFGFTNVPNNLIKYILYAGLTSQQLTTLEKSGEIFDRVYLK